MRVLTVCLGNICRSPTAEAALRAAADEVGLPLDIDSAGTGDWHIGELPDERMRRAAASAGLTLAGRARQVEVADLDTFDLVLPMDHDNLQVLERLAGNGTRRARIALFRTWDPLAGGDTPPDVPDPYYGGTKGFEEVVEICRRTAVALVAELRAS